MAGSSVEQCMAIIREIENNLSGARKALMGKDDCIVNRAYLLGRVQQLQNSLPTAMQTAQEYVRSITSIQHQTDQECTTLRRDAQQKAQQTISDAQQQASETLAKAERTAQDTLNKAQAEANRLLEDAQRRAQIMVSQEEIVRRARVEASETQQNAQEELAHLRQSTFDYLDSIMAQLDRHLSETLSDLRLERNELNNHRA